MYIVRVPRATSPVGTVGFLLVKIGQATTERFAEKLAPLELRPKHCGLLAAIAAAKTASQQELGRAMKVVPSAIVTMVDDLEEMGAVRRIEVVDDRRRYSIELTDRGRSLLARASQMAHDLDQEILAELTATERAALERKLIAVAAALGVSSGRGPRDV